MRAILGVLFMLAVLVAAVAITFALIALARRDQRRRGGSGQLGAAMQNLESLFVESKKHVIEAQQDEHSDEDDSGEPPEP